MTPADGVGPRASPRRAGDAADRALAAVDQTERDLRAWAHLDPGNVRAQAAAIDADDRSLPLRALTVGVKDVFDTFDMPTAFGSPIYAGRRPDRDAAAVADLRTAGALIVGKTHTAEFAFMHPAPTVNPWNPEHTPGGSSSGSAAAVAAGVVDAAIGTQTAGSVIRPAAFCGVVGYKPTFGLISRSGVLECGGSLDTVGVIAATVSTAATVGATLAHQPELAELAPPSGPRRLALWRAPGWERADAAARDAVVAAAAALTGPERSAVVVDAPGWHADALADQRVIMRHEAALAFGHERSRHWHALSAPMQEQIAEGDGYTSERVALARRRRAAAARMFAAVWDDVDVIVTAPTFGEAPHGLSSTGDPTFASVWTLLGVPAVTVPWGLGPGGLPIGVQLIARWNDDADLLATASLLSTMAPALPPPPISASSPPPDPPNR